jgi:hypothetical protein
VPVQRILAGAPAVLRFTLTDQEGEPRAPLGAVTVGITRSDGSVLLASGAATTSTDEVGTVTVSLSAPQLASIDELTVTWTEANGGTFAQTVDVTGGVYFSVQDLRTADRAMRDAIAKFPAEDIVRIRQDVEVECERITGRAFVRRVKRVTLSGNGKSWIRLPDVDVHAVRSLKVNGAPYGVGSYMVSPSGRVDLGVYNQNWGIDDDMSGVGPRFGAGRSNVEVVYEYGAETPPADLKRAAMVRARSLLVADKSGIPSRATSMTSDGTNITLATPGTRDWNTGIPEVDAVYNAYSRQDNPTDSEFVGSVRIL